MDDFLKLESLKKPYSLSLDARSNVTVPSNIIKLCGKQDVFVIDFLYRSYKKELNGVVLNVEDDFNVHLQISAFIGATNNALKNYWILIICPDDAVVRWHYYLSLHRRFEITIITKNTTENEIGEDKDRGRVLIVSFSNIKVLEPLKNYTFFVVIIDKFEEVVMKMMIRNILSNFNIGVTYRNFYVRPDQKMQWTMLNWTNPGHFGKLLDFYETDNDNFAHFRDNYKQWWFRITWSFCDSFVRPSLEEKGNLNKVIRKWAQENNLSVHILDNKNVKTRKQAKKVHIQNEELADVEENLPKRLKVYDEIRKEKNQSNTCDVKGGLKNNIKSTDETESNDSSDTVIYGEFHTENENVQEAEKNEPPIVYLAQKSAFENSRVNTCDFDDTGSMSSEEQLIISLTNEKVIDNNIEIVRKQEHFTNNYDDESDLFLKSVAAKNDAHMDRIQQTEQFLNDILHEKSSDIEQFLNTDLELPQRRTLHVDLAADNDKFLREIGTEKNVAEENISGVGNKNSGCTSNTVSDVDKLVAEVMAMVGD